MSTKPFCSIFLGYKIREQIKKHDKNKQNPEILERKYSNLQKGLKKTTNQKHEQQDNNKNTNKTGKRFLFITHQTCGNRIFEVVTITWFPSRLRQIFMLFPIHHKLFRKLFRHSPPTSLYPNNPGHQPHPDRRTPRHGGRPPGKNNAGLSIYLTQNTLPLTNRACPAPDETLPDISFPFICKITSVLETESV